LALANGKRLSKKKGFSQTMISAKADEEMLFSIRQLKLTAIKSFTNLLIQITASSWGLLHFVRNDALINGQQKNIQLFGILKHFKKI